MVQAGTAMPQGADGRTSITRLIGPQALPGFVRQVDATLRAVRNTRLRVSVVAATATGVTADVMASAVRRALGAQEPMTGTVSGDGVVFLYIGPRANSDRDDLAAARRIDMAIANMLAQMGLGGAALSTLCVHRWADELDGADDLVLALTG